MRARFLALQMAIVAVEIDARGKNDNCIQGSAPRQTPPHHPRPSRFPAIVSITDPWTVVSADWLGAARGSAGRSFRSHCRRLRKLLLT
jgi:hypothetical protein